jgi:hypothetical protein
LVVIALIRFGLSWPFPSFLTVLNQIHLTGAWFHSGTAPLEKLFFE